jgi:hypothetical protein
LIISFSIEIKKWKLVDLIDSALISVEADQQLSEIINQGIIDKIYNDIVIPELTPVQFYYSKPIAKAPK